MHVWDFWLGAGFCGAFSDFVEGSIFAERELYYVRYLFYLLRGCGVFMLKYHEAVRQLRQVASFYAVASVVGMFDSIAAMVRYLWMLEFGRVYVSLVSMVGGRLLAELLDS